MSNALHSPLPQKAIVTVTEGLLAQGLSGLRWQLRDLVMDGAYLVVIDVSEVDQISSNLLAALLDTHRVCRRRGGGVVIRHANRKTTELLRRTGLDRVFAVEPAA
ncbi:anti-sigma-factor antagonist [Kribbella flavida DSM 17836]|uniref:Anti-sigma-factor antagonist n=1 Tax=Kribbella flavida (strain DSM 17836 / JCM 10339 / NBRC 14399) TaxID=479435 RepID=D2PQ26_KRIFD|nr:STAS domain-containing protein [Kribbella flavida]ADB32950.1 anti-sigma-factor antagonist [Kribbella flavida DSM 17836]